MKKYANDFQPGEKGYEYAGDWYELRAAGEELKRWCLSFSLCLAAVSVLFPLGLTRNNGGSHVFFILLPYIGLFLPLAYGWMAVWGLFSLAGKKREDRCGGTLAEEENQQAKDDVQQENDAAGQEKGAMGRKNAHLRLRRMDYERCIRRPWRCALALTVLSGIALTADLIWLAMQGGEVHLSDEVFFLVILLGIFVLSLLSALQTGRLYRRASDASSPEK